MESPTIWGMAVEGNRRKVDIMTLNWTILAALSWAKAEAMMQPKTRVELTGANGGPVAVADDTPSMDSYCSQDRAGLLSRGARGKGRVDRVCGRWGLTVHQVARSQRAGERVALSRSLAIRASMVVASLSSLRYRFARVSRTRRCARADRDGW
jgi:hypothetical protein